MLLCAGHLDRIRQRRISATGLQRRIRAAVKGPVRSGFTARCRGKHVEAGALGETPLPGNRGVF